MSKFNLSSLIYIIFICLPLTDVFWVFNKIPSVIYTIYILSLSFFIYKIIVNYKKKIILNNRWYYIVIINLLAIILTSFIYNEWTYHGFQYLLWFIWIFSMYALFVKVLFDNLNPMYFNNNFFILVLMIYSIIAIIDWSSVNSIIKFYSLNDLVSRGENNFDSLGFGYIRLRGTIEEGAHYALYLNILYPISIAFSNYSIKIKFLITIPILISYILSASLSAWLFGLIGFLTAIIIIYYRNYKFILKSIFILFLLFGLSYAFGIFNNELFLRLSNPDDVSTIQRLNIYSNALSDILNQNFYQFFLGYGPANFIDKYDTNPVSWYILFMHDFGFLSILLIIILLVGIFLSVIKSNLSKEFKLCILTSIFAAFLHYGFTANIWHPWLWFIIAFSLYVSKKLDLYI